jgi:hypothetical protein
VAEVQQAEALSFSDSASCKAWVRSLPLTNVAQAQAELLDQVSRLNATEFPPVERFRILELLREPSLFAQTELAKKFNHKPLPLAEVERKSFQAVIRLWKEFADGYRICIKSCLAFDPALNKDADAKDPKDAKATVSREAKDAKELPKYAAAMCHRALVCTGIGMIDHLRANHHFPVSYWTDLHAIYRDAEQLGVTETGVLDPVSRDKNERTCKGAYVAPMLLVLANPHEMFQRHILMVARWLERWAEKTVISKTAPESPDKPPLMVDLASAAGAYRSNEPGEDQRWIDISGLSHTMKKRVHYLRKGQSPQELFLGDDCLQPACEALLVLLYQHWCDGRETRVHPRRKVASRALACSGFEAMHYYISGSTFRQPDTRSEIDRYHHREDITTYGSGIGSNLATGIGSGASAGKRDEEGHSLIHGFIQEEWQVENETVAGLRLVRPANSPGARLSQLQLIAVKPADAKSFMLAVVRWAVMVGDDLTIGVRLLPGQPTPVGARSTGVNARNEKFQPAFLTGPVPALQATAAAILPPGLYKKDKVLEIHSETLSKIKLGDSLERGFDYERSGFEVTSG